MSDYVDQTGAAVAHFEYDPFGNLTVDSYNNAAAFPYRFSTKPQDGVTGLYYYGYRWFDPVTGRWPSRDPIEEEGGVNLFGFLRNRSNGWYDFLGEDPKPTEPKPELTPQQITKDIKERSDENNAPWMDTVAGEIGVKEDPDPKKCCPAIEKYANSLNNLNDRTSAKKDEVTPWCGCFMNWVFKQNGFDKDIPKSPLWAKAWENCWCEIDRPVFGAIVVFDHSGGGGHVGFVAGTIGDGEIIVVGGNQDSQVQPSRYNRDGWTGKPDNRVKVRRYRYPCHLLDKAKNPIDYSGSDTSKIDKVGDTR
ncbi:MAG: TIGR02594 family protein [Akkermansiaceae bacterium]|nr:TIGR02594 family protein [Akkermansiaceae bacterium]